MIHLIRHVLIADNGTGDELGEQRHIGAERDHIALHTGFLPVYVDDIGHDLEGVERDTDREGDQRGGQVGEQRDALQNAGNKAGVFEESQQPQIDNDTGNEQNFGGAFLILVFMDQ